MTLDSFEAKGGKEISAEKKELLALKDEMDLSEQLRPDQLLAAMKEVFPEDEWKLVPSDGPVKVNFKYDGFSVAVYRKGEEEPRVWVAVAERNGVKYTASPYEDFYTTFVWGAELDPFMEHFQEPKYIDVYNLIPLSLEQQKEAKKAIYAGLQELGFSEIFTLNNRNLARPGGHMTDMPDHYRNRAFVDFYSEEKRLGGRVEFDYMTQEYSLYQTSSNRVHITEGIGRLILGPTKDLDEIIQYVGEHKEELTGY